MVRIENNSHMLEITCYVAFLIFLRVFGTFLLEVVKNSFFWHETYFTTLFVV